MIIYFEYLAHIKKNFFFKDDIEYLIKKKYFYKEKIKIFYPILIPRQDTECIINIQRKITNKEKKIIIYELGSGSNNINKTIKIKKNLNIDNNFLCYLTKKNKKKVYLLNHWQFLTKITKKCKLIISNPPYIEKKELNINKKEKLKTNNLISKKKGLQSIYDIIKQSKNILFNNGTIILEYGYNQSKKIRYFSTINGFNSYIFNDCNNIKRFIYLDI